MRYYISDCHFFHRSLLHAMDKRPFSSVEEMNEKMIEAWNQKVRKNDEVVILGDFSWGNGEETMEILKKLHGKKFLIRGNHDLYLKDKNFDPSLFGWIKDYAELHDNKRKVILSHYPIACYNGQYRLDSKGNPRAWMLYGHIHETQDQQFLDAYCDMVSHQYHHQIGSHELKPIPVQMINCFCVRSDYVPLSLDEWIALENNRQKFLSLEIRPTSKKTSLNSSQIPNYKKPLKRRK